jgi:MFS family permease
MVYPVLIAAVADRVPAAERATALGIYRFFRDSGYAIGAIAAGVGLAGSGGVELTIAGALVLLAGVAALALKTPGHRA